MTMRGEIQIEGLKEFQKSLKTLDKDLPKLLRVTLNEAADLVVADAKGGVPSRGGKAKRSIKASSTRTAARVKGGGNKAPYYPWLDFGGVIPKTKVRRPVLADGRYIYKAYYRKRPQFGEMLERGLIRIADQAGVEVT